MSHYEVYIIESIGNGNDVCKLRFETNNIDAACDKATELENQSNEKFDATAIYDCRSKKWFGYHKKGTAHILSK